LAAAQKRRRLLSSMAKRRPAPPLVRSDALRTGQPVTGFARQQRRGRICYDTVALDQVVSRAFARSIAYLPQQTPAECWIQPIGFCQPAEQILPEHVISRVHLSPAFNATK